ncbi:hypothetical protein D9615_007371 [Tricholomella constricta]|uniref:G-patch domain-containing protein n=1 Tax=Tricholomella constricta TaxID=117010 RepID=A0A8H5GYS6_9AGAR|nr:hypothetical protein D9615_007371 [Tricholomella constricta]
MLCSSSRRYLHLVSRMAHPSIHIGVIVNTVSDRWRGNVASRQSSPRSIVSVLTFIEMSPKRKLQATADFDEYALKDVPGELRKCDQNLAAAVVLDFVYESGFTLRRLGKHEAERPAFASATWEDVATNFQLDASIDYHQLELFSYPVASLPPSFHREVMKASAKWLDVYQERGAHKRGAARMRLMDAWHVPVCSLFKGRLVDQPESFMPETPETSRGQVDHKVYMTEGIILLVMELKLAFKSVQDHIAQVLLELCSAFEINSDEEFKPQPPVYAILTDLEDFHIFRYDGSQFTRIKKIIVSDESRVEYLSGMQKGDSAAMRTDEILLAGCRGWTGATAALQSPGTRAVTTNLQTTTKGEGWAPSTFVSSRSDRAKQKAARPEDFMDEEDLQELKDSRKLVDTTDEMNLTSDSRGGVAEPEQDSLASALETTLLPPPSDSAGARILKKMGWRLGQGIGPRVSLRKRKLQDMELSLGGRVSSELVNIPDDDEEDRKDDSHGLGYNPGMGLHESVGGKKAATSAHGPQLAAGFGLGALNDADEDDLDVYDGGPTSHRRREAYDAIDRDEEDTFAIGGRSQRGKKPTVRPASSVARFRDGQPVLAGFILSDKPVSDDRWFPLPDVPKGWTPDPRRVWNKYNNKENMSEQREPLKASGGWDSKITADERGAMLGETPLPSAPRSVFEFMSKKDRERLQNIAASQSQPSFTPGTTTHPSASSPPETIRIPKTEPHIAQAALRGFQPFAEDPAKQSRYNAYLQSQIGTDAAGPPLQPLPAQRVDEFNKEAEDYAKAALLFKPMSSAMAGRFTSAAVVDHGPKIPEGLHTPSHEDIAKKEEEKRIEEEENLSPKAHAVRMGMYGPLTRETKPWQPARLLCKRFKVRDPNPEPEMAIPSEPAAPGSNWQQPDIPMASTSAETGGEGSSGSGSWGAARKGPKDISNIGLGEDEDQGRDTLTYERPTMDVFKAIFASDDEDSDDDKGEPAEEPPLPVAIPMTVLMAPSTDPTTAVSSFAPMDDGPVDLSSFKPTFIPREGKLKKDKDKDKDKGRDKDKEKKEKKKREKEKRAVLSFAMDEEGGEELAPKLSKDRPKKKKQRKEKRGAGDDDDGMWVEKPAAEAVKDLVLPPPPPQLLEDENVADPGGPPRGRKRAVDFL